MNDVPLAARVTREPVRRPWVRYGSRVALFSAVVGLLLRFADPDHNGLGESLLYSECIGLAIFGGYTALRIAAGERRRSLGFVDYLLRGTVAIPVGYLIGLNVASWLMGRRVDYSMLVSAGNIALPVTLVASGCLMYYFWSSNRIAEAAVAKADADCLVAEARLKLLQAQIEPHMLFNTLANLRTLVEVEPRRAQAMIDQLIVYLRGTLAASRSTTTTLDAEFAQLAAYLDLMKVRMAARLHSAFDLPEALRTAAIPPMLLQPLVENAIKHGLEPQIGGGSVRVTAGTSAGILWIEVADDGIGLDRDAAAAGYGLEHVRERLHTLYGAGGRLTIDARPGGGVVARVEIPR